MSGKDEKSKLLWPLVSMLRPIVRLMVKYNISFDTFFQTTRKLYAEEAKEELVIPGKKISISRISIMTGIPRKVIQQCLEHPFDNERNSLHGHNRASRVVTGWMTDEDYLDEKQQPLNIPYEGELSFVSLVKKYSGGVPAKAVMDELLRIDAIAKVDDNLLQLNGYGYTLSKNDEETFLIVSENVADLMNTILFNLDNDAKESKLQLRVAASNLPVEAAQLLRASCTKQGREMLIELGKQIQDYDRDHNDKVFGTGRVRAGIGMYYFEQQLEEGGDDQEKN